MKIDLFGEWTLKTQDFGELSAKVPGTVLSTLLEHDLIPDPFKEKNEIPVREYLLKDYTFTRKFNISKECLSKKNFLFMDSIDTVADVYINNQLIAHLENMHRRYRFELDNSLLKEENEISIEFKSNLKYIYDSSDDKLFMTYGESEKKGPALRKAHYMFGWDWGPNLPDMGILRNIYILSTDIGYLDSFRTHQSFKDNKCILDIESYGIKVNDSKIKYELFFKKELVSSFESNFGVENSTEFIIDSPKLWYPVGYGDQNLYNLKISLDSLSEHQEYNYRIGLKELVIDDSKDEYGRKLVVRINGLDIFLKGADYIPQDNILTRVNESNTYKLLKMARDFNHNVIRVWGGGYYLDDYFYDICDELGLLVFQDLMFACSAYDMTDEKFTNEIKEETIDALKRLRHHTSIFLICGNNENELAVCSWNPYRREDAKKYYIKQYLWILKGIVRRESDFYYLSSSPTSGDNLFENPNDMNYLDMHYWDVWHGYKPYEAFKEIYPRLLSEFGVQSFPIYDTVEYYTLGKEEDLFSPIMMHHQKNKTCNDKILGYINNLYKEAKDFKSLVYLSQLSQAEGIKLCAEHIRQNRPRCHGVIYWQLNDCWPGQSWSSIDYFFNPKALLYFAKKFYQDELISVNDEGKEIRINVSNDTLKDEAYKVVYKFIDFESNIIDKKEIDFIVPKMSQNDALIIDNPFKKNDKDKLVIAELIKNNKLISRNIYSVFKPKDMMLEKPNLEITKIDDYTIMLKTNHYTKNIYLEPHDQEIIFSDNYFDLLKDEKVIITSNKKIDFNKLEVRNLFESMR